MEEAPLVLDQTGPTYATEKSFEEAMLAAGAGIALVDAVVAASKGGQKLCCLCWTRESTRRQEKGGMSASRLCLAAFFVC
jgi:hypothetical protein